MPKTKDEPINATLEITGDESVIELDEETVEELVDEVELPVEPEKKAEPKPGDAGYDWAPHYDSADLYTYTFPGGQVVAIRPFSSIYSKTFLYKLRNAQTDTDVQFAAIDRAACDVAQAVLESIEAPIGEKDPLDELWEAWIAAGTNHGDGEGLTTGE